MVRGLQERRLYAAHLPAAARAAPFDPEFAESYEIGFKFDAENARLRLNGAAYFTDYTDLQVQVLVGVQPLTANAGGAEVQGFELELQAVPVEDLEITAGVGYTDAGYTSLDPTVLATGVTLGSEFAQVPEWTGTFDIAYTFRVGAGRVIRSSTHRSPTRPTTDAGGSPPTDRT